MAKKSAKKKPAAKTTGKKTTKKSTSVKKKAAPKKKAAKKKVSRKTARPAKSTSTKKKKADTKPKQPKPASGPVPVAWAEPPPEREPLTPEQIRQVKTDLTGQDLKTFRGLLLEKRAEIVGDVAHMEEARNDNSGGNLSHMPLHMADVGSDNYEQEFTLGLMESEKRLLHEIDEALVRIRDGTYGVCHESGKPINRARLEIKPWAKYSIEVARERERRGL